MNILIPTVDYPPIEGGISTVALEVSRALAARGHQVTVAAPYFPNMESFDAAEPATVLRWHGYGLGPLRIVPFFRAAWPHARQADLILAINNTYGGALGWLARKRFGVPYVAFAYAYEFLKYRKHPMAARLLRGIYGAARMAVAISEYTREQLAAFGVDPAHIETIRPGAAPAAPIAAETLNAVRERMTLDTGPIILGVGRFIPRKGFRTLVRALPAILERHPGALMILVGRGPDISPVCKIAHKLGVREHLVLPGRLEDAEVAALYALCDVFALPTGEGANGHVEGFGLVFTEAHAHGKPVVAGRSGGVVDAVLDGETGILVAPGDEAALATAINGLLDDPARARVLGEAGRRRVASELNWACFTDRLLDAVEARQ